MHKDSRKENKSKFRTISHVTNTALTLTEQVFSDPPKSTHISSFSSMFVPNHVTYRYLMVS